ncbi:hypothetical protein [Mucilaginibacter panaciglaebae]|uniref:Uncharacterized protein n=1 Tax=Mucilaginibacter panaciglaebae TaxID=502331 RepID=A0ABP7W9I2_9SPHI
MNDTLEKLEAIEEVLQQVIVTINGYEKKEVKIPEIRIPDYKKELCDISGQLNELKQNSGNVQLNKLSEQIQQLNLSKQPVKQYRFLLFPETNQGQYYKIVFGRLIPWGILLMGLVFLFALAQKGLDVWRVKEYNQQADKYVKAWNYMNNHADSKLVKKRMDEAWKRANQ